jgi:hypothetical protein
MDRDIADLPLSSRWVLSEVSLLSRCLQKLITSSSVYQRVVFTIVQFVTRPSPDTVADEYRIYS